MDSSAEQTFMRTGRNSGWRPVRLRPVRVSFRCPSGARPLALALGWWWLGFTWAEHAARTPHPRFGDRWQAHARRRASHRVLLASREIEQRAYAPAYAGATVQSADRSASATRDQSPRSCVRLRRRGGVTTRGARLLGRLVSAEWIVPLRYWRAAALCTTGLFALRDWLMIHGSDPRHRPIRDCPRPPQDEGFLRQTVEMISVSRSEEDQFARAMGFPPTSRAQ